MVMLSRRYHHVLCQRSCSSFVLEPLQAAGWQEFTGQQERMTRSQAEQVLRRSQTHRSRPNKSKLLEAAAADLTEQIRWVGSDCEQHSN
jgi:hypothetical protein